MSTVEKKAPFSIVGVYGNKKVSLTAATKQEAYAQFQVIKGFFKRVYKIHTELDGEWNLFENGDALTAVSTKQDVTIKIIPNAE